MLGVVAGGEFVGAARVVAVALDSFHRRVVTPVAGCVRAWQATDPVTLAFRSGEALTAASIAASPANQTLNTDQVQTLLADALLRWQHSGVNTSGLGAIQLQITNLGGTTVGFASGHTIWLDSNAAGWGWFVDPTPWDDAEFTTPGNQGEQRPMDLLTVLEHELGHVLGYDHANVGVMADTLEAGTRRSLGKAGFGELAAVL